MILKKWAQDLKEKLEKDIEEKTLGIEQLKKEAKLTRDLKGKLEKNKEVRELEKKPNEIRRNLYEQQDEIEDQKERLFDDIERRLEQKITTEQLQKIKWKII